MPRKLVIVESPAKAKTISNFLGKGYQVEASYGHVRDLPASRKDIPEKYKKEKWADFAVNVEDQFQPIYVVVEERNKKKHIATLKEALRDADELLLATDEDREGESISWHLIEVLKPKVPVKRIVFHEITREAIEEALRTPRDLDMDLVRAQEGRRVIDRLFGYKLSPLLWRKVQPKLSAGRVQSAAVRLLVEREEERRAFVSAQYWDVEADIAAPTGVFKAKLVSLAGKSLAQGKDFDPSTGKLSKANVVLLDEAKALDLRKRLEKALPWSVKAVDEKPATQRPYPPFTTSTLQQEANRKLGYGAQRTMRIAQKLYEGIDLGGNERVGLITYMRTDSVTLSQKALGEAQTVIRGMYGGEYATGPRPYKTKTANAQEAHEAIRPSSLGRRPADVSAYLEKDELALYELIWKRTIASQMPDARLLRTTVEISAVGDSGNEAIFTASGKKILFPGFLRAYVEGSDDPNAELGDQETILPDLQPGQKIAAPGAPPSVTQLKALHEKKHETVPPARYTEASLVKKLEEEGIGRPSTYASIISTIQDRGYCTANKSRQLVPTFVAWAVINLLRDHFPEYVDLKFTARMEEELDQIASGDLEWTAQLARFYRGTGDAPGLEQQVELKQQSIDFPMIALGRDPETNEPVNVRIGRYGPYLMRGENGNAVMADVPADLAPADLKLEDALRILKNRKEGPRELGTDPSSGELIYVMDGRYGAYVQVGATPEDKGAPKPRRASLEGTQRPDTITLEEALALLAFPKQLGVHPDDGQPVLVNKGKFGPYVQHNRDFRSLKKTDDLFTIDFERALQLLAEPKGVRGMTRTVLNDLGDGLQVLDGKHGPYVTDGTTNATLPKELKPEDVTKEKALALIAERASSGKSAKKAPARKTATAKPAAKKTTTTKKPSAKKPK
ncbi:type I DNA topoisomerase [bacterium]|nr:type I DNA topoisomerase [bacterium]